MEKLPFSTNFDTREPESAVRILPMEGISIGLDRNEQVLGILLHRASIRNTPAVFLSEKQVVGLICELQGALRALSQL